MRCRARCREMALDLAWSRPPPWHTWRPMRYVAGGWNRARACVCLVGLIIVAAGGALPAGAGTETDAAAGALEVQSVYVHIPQVVPTDRPLRVLVALHGMGGNGQDFSQNLLSISDTNGWLLVAPTINYGDWTDPSQVANEDPALIAWLNSYLDELPSDTGLNLTQRVVLFGHSRGAQLALRFTEFHPERVRAVAAVSAGTYTLPFASDAQNQPILFPFGVGDLATRDGGRPFDVTRFDTVSTWIGVGSNDANPSDLPRAWDPYLGTTRVQRAQAFVAALQQIGADVHLTVFPGATHGLTPDIQQVECANLAAAQAASTPADASSPSSGQS
jgi:pimeloyl-ACP methyl ester carboxylesterase